MSTACKIITGLVVMYFASRFYYLLTGSSFKETILDVFSSAIFYFINFIR